MTAPGTDRAVDPELPFIDVWGLLRRRWTWLAGGLAVGVWLGGVALLVLTPPYKSEAQVLVIQKDPNLPAKGVDRGGELTKDVYEGLLSTHVQLLKGPEVVRRAIRRHRLDLLPSLEAVRDADDADGSKAIIKNLEVTIGDKTDPTTEGGHVLRVAFKHPSGEDGAAILRAVLESYQQFVAEKFHDVGTEAVALIKRAQVELAGDLKAEETAYLDFLGRAPLLWRGDGGKGANLHQERLLKIEASLADVQLRLTEARARYEVVEAALRGSAAAGAGAADLERLVLLDDKEVNRLTLLLAATKQDSNNEAFQAAQPNRTEAIRAKYEQYLALVTREQALLLTLGADHPKVREVRESLRLVREFLETNAPAAGAAAGAGRIKPDELVNAYVHMLRHDLDELERSRRELEALSEREGEAAKTLVGYELRGEAMRQEVARKRALYDGVIDRLREINLIRDFAGIVTEVVAPPEVGEPPDRWAALVLAVGGMLGLFGGGALGWGAEQRDRTIHGPADARRQAPGLPILARLPGVDAAAPGRAEALRGLRAALGHAGWGERSKVLQVAAAAPGSGGTALVADLAALMARSGRRVLAIDADLRRPALHGRFGLPPAPGLSDVLAGAAAPDDAIRPTPVEGLHLLGGGPPPDSPAELLASPRFARLIRDLRDRYEAIILDGPVLSDAADAAELARHVDGVLLTVRVGQTEGLQVRRAAELLAGVGAGVVGLVVDGCGAGDD